MQIEKYVYQQQIMIILIRSVSSLHFWQGIGFLFKIFKLKKMDSKTKSKIALGVILGVAAGAAVYYFMTNENGKQQFSDVIDAIKDFSDKVKDTASEQSQNLAKKASDASTKLADRASSLSSKLADKVSGEVENYG